MAKPHVAVFGAAGMLGTATVPEWRDHGYQVTALTHPDLDVTEASHVDAIIARLSPGIVINCTAYNRVDEAEENLRAAFLLNGWAVRNLAQAAARARAVFVHYSTDFVFDGRASQPYGEADATNPESAYAMSKRVGEWMAGEAPRHYVLRVESLFGGPASRSTIDSMHTMMRAGKAVTPFSDRVVSPSYVPDVARATRHLVERKSPFGIYHCVNSGHATWLEVAERLREWSGLQDAEIRGQRTADVTLKAKRPQFAALSNAKLAAQGFEMPRWEDAVQRHLATRQSGSQ
jgi:dTDP-4-dehydrorhamnose reductase